MKKILILAALLTGLTATRVSAQAQIPPFQEGEKVVLVGDSITHGGHYHSYIWLYYVTHVPGMRIEMLNAGMGGECAWDMAARLDYDVLALEPTYLTLTFGMNDTGYGEIYGKPGWEEKSAERVRRSLESFAEMEEKLAARAQMKTVMIGGSPFDETTCFNPHKLTGKNDAMRKLTAAQREAARRHGWGFVDFLEPMVDISLREQAKDSTFSFCSLDRVHPDCDGQMVMAWLFLRAQGLAGLPVADVSLTAKGKVRRSENCRISNVRKEAGGLTFDYLAASLPYPADSIAQNGWSNKRSARDAMDLIPFNEEFNQERLQVTGLEAGSYLLTIDRVPVGRFTAAQLEEGINLGVIPHTPQYRQATAVMYLNEERLQVEKRLVEYRWVRNEYLRKAGLLGLEDEESTLQYLNRRAQRDFFLAISMNWYRQARDPRIRETWDAYRQTLTDRMYELAQPVTRQVSLQKADSD